MINDKKKLSLSYELVIFPFHTQCTLYTYHMKCIIKRSVLVKKHDRSVDEIISSVPV